MSSSASASSPSPVGGAVFLSYASQDADAVRRIGEVLQAAGIEVWFDQDELVGGDAWDAKIRKQIKDCALFVPVISAATQARLEGYFRLEWKLAAQRSHTMAEAKPFLLPVVIDATRDAEAHVPEEFRAVQWTRLPGGEASAAFCAHMRSLLGGPVGMETGRPRPALRDGGVASPTTPPVGRRVPAAAWVIALLVLVGAGVFVWRQSKLAVVAAKNAGAGTRPPTTEKFSDSAAPRLGLKSIAVLPFDNLSEDKEAGTSFADGMHDDLITNLLLIREVRPVPRTTAMTYRGTKKTNREIADELGVAFLLTGTVRRADKDLRITATLINARSDEALWSKPYNKVLTGAGVIFAIQSELAQAIAGELKATLSPQEKKLVERRPTENTAAYDLYLKARDSFYREGAERVALEKQEALLQAAVTLDPKFAVAWGELAHRHARYYGGNYDFTDARLARAKQAIDTAVGLAPDSPDVVRDLGNYFLHGLRDYPKAVAQFEKIAVVRPNDPEIYAALGDVQQRQGRWAEAMGNLGKAFELDPGNAVVARNAWWLSFAGRRYDETIAIGRRLVALMPDVIPVGFYLAYLEFNRSGSQREVDDFFRRLSPAQANSPEGIKWRKWWMLESGDFAEAIRLAKQHPSTITEIQDGGWAILVGTAFAAVAQDDPAEARQLIAAHYAACKARLAREPDNTDMLWILGLMEALMGNREEALRLAGRAVELVPKSLDAVSSVTATNRLAVVYAWTGEKEKSLTEAARLLRTPFGGMTVYMMRHDPFWFPLRGDPRFEALLNDPKNNAPLF